MKILEVNCVYKKGSTGKITADLSDGLIKKGYNVTVLYGRGEKNDEKNVYKTCSETYSKITNALSKIGGNPYGYAFFSTQKLIKLIKQEKPDIVHLQCINGYFVNIYRLLNFLGKTKIKTVLTLHAEFMYTGGCGYAFDCEKYKTQCGGCESFKKDFGSLFFENSKKCFIKMKKAFSYFEDENLSIVAVSPWLKNRAEESAILGGKNINVVFNGVDDEVFCLKTSIKEKYRKLAEKYNKKALYVTSFFSLEKGDVKGGEHIINLAKLLPDILFMVAGDHGEINNLPENVVLLGKITDRNELAELYSFADIVVLTSKRETFSMVCAESLCCGTEVVGFNAGAPEQISIPKYSKFVEYGDLDALKDAIIEKTEKVGDKEPVSNEAKEIYGKEKMVENYIKVYRKLLKNG